MGVKDVVETIPSHGILITEALVVHHPQFLTPDTWVKLAYFFHELYDKFFSGQTTEKESVIVLVIRLPRYPKQFANAAHGKF